MSTIPASQLDLTTPPIIKVIQRRSLVIGGVASVVALYLAFTDPTVFFRGYLLSYMDWLGICLGSMAIVMVRHMTGGGWGTVIRRILGASMRTMPLLILLFIPYAIFAVRRLYPWAMPLDSIADPAIREHLEKHAFILRDYLNYRGFVIRAVIYFAIWFALQYFLSKFSFEHDRPPFADTSARFKMVSAPGIILYTVTISFAAIDWVMSLDPSWVSTIYGLLFVAGELISALCFAIVIERILFNYQPMSTSVEAEFCARPRQLFARVHHGVGLLLILAVAHHLGRQLAGRDYLVLPSSPRRMAVRWAVSGDLPFLRSVFPVALALLQTRRYPPGLAGLVDARRALR